MRPGLQLHACTAYSDVADASLPSKQVSFTGVLLLHRVLFSTDQSFPLAGAFAYSVYQFQSKRVKRNPDGPFFGGNAIVGAIFSTLCCLAVACGVSPARTLVVI